MLIPKAHKVAVYSKLFNGERKAHGVMRCAHIQTKSECARGLALAAEARKTPLRWRLERRRSGG
jgi:hypothetical protein